MNDNSPHIDQVQESPIDRDLRILRGKIDELKPWSELGMLAVQAISECDNVCTEGICSEDSFDGGLTCQECAWFKFCKKRAEVVAD